MSLYDAHNHLQDERLEPHLDDILTALAGYDIRGMVVNGATEADWEDVLQVCAQVPGAIPSFGYHPWYVKERTAAWQKKLVQFLDCVPSAVGEIGLDRWIRDYDIRQQEEVFTWQWRLACERKLPVTVHCLQAWGRLGDLLRKLPRCETGFVLHSFGGPKEMIPQLADLGAYFSIPGYFAHERKGRQREAFRHVPADRLLIETDAPDQLLPESRIRHPLDDPNGEPLNHPANLKAVYEFAAEALEVPLDGLTLQVEENFLRVFGKLFPNQERLETLSRAPLA